MAEERSSSYTLKDMPESMRPRERLLREGASKVSEPELLAIILGTGTSDETVLALAQRVLSRVGNLRGLAEASEEELKRIRGIGPAKVAQIQGALELGRRAYHADTGNLRQDGSQSGNRRLMIDSPETAAMHTMSEMRFLDREQLRVLCLDTRNQLLGESVVSLGTVNSSLAHPRECFKEAIRRSSTAVVFVHNHPSGDPTPSAEDSALTRQLTQAGKLLGIEVVDHVIIGDGVYVSMKEKGLL